MTDEEKRDDASGDVSTEQEQSDAYGEAPVVEDWSTAEGLSEEPATESDTQHREHGFEARPVFCVVCGAEMERGDTFCHACGWDTRTTPNAPPPRLVDPNPSSYNRLTALLLCVLLGFLGLHRFYVGKVGTGLVWLFTLGFLGVGQIFDLVLIATGEFRDANGLRVLRWSDAQVGSDPSS